jgi:hypothetical protein
VRALRAPRGCAQIPGVPLLFVHSTGVGLELPTEEQRHEAVRHPHTHPCMAFASPRPLPACASGAPWLTRCCAAAAQEVRGAVPAHERAALQLEAGAATRVRTNVQFKRNVAKGPNPLAMKKKRKADAPPPQPQAGEVRAWHACGDRRCCAERTR